MKNKKSKIIGFLVGLSLFGALVFGGATFSRIKVWVSGETLTASDLNAEFNNVLNNFNPAGVDDYSNSLTEMRTTSNPYPGSAESQPTSLQGELERIRYMILQLKKAIVHTGTNDTYWYQTVPAQGTFEIYPGSITVTGTNGGPATTGSLQTSIFRMKNLLNNSTLDFGVNGSAGWIQATDVTDASLNYMLKLNQNGGDIQIGSTTATTTIPGTLAVSSNAAITGNLAVTGTLTANALSKVSGFMSTDETLSVTPAQPNLMTWTEDSDSNSEFNGSTFTANSAGYYLVNVCITVLGPSGGPDSGARLNLNKNGLNSPLAYNEISLVASEKKVMSFGYIVNLAANDKLNFTMFSATTTTKAKGGGSGGYSNFSIYKLL